MLNTLPASTGFQSTWKIESPIAVTFARFFFPDGAEIMINLYDIKIIFA